MAASINVRYGAPIAGSPSIWSLGEQKTSNYCFVIFEGAGTNEVNEYFETIRGSGTGHAHRRRLDSDASAPRRQQLPQHRRSTALQRQIG